MPYPNEHACRLNPPSKYQAGSFRRIQRGEGENRVSIIIARPKGKTTTEGQAIRYPKEVWTASRARSDCQNRNGTFEAAATTASELDVAHLKEGRGEYLIIPKGQFSHPQYGKLNFNDKFMDEMIANFNDKVLGETQPFVDQDHDQRGAAGWIVGLSKTAEGIKGVIEWTPVGIELIKNRIYRYFSPTISSYTDPQSGQRFNNVLRGGALTNMPFLKMLPEITLEEGALVEIALSEITQEESIVDILEDLKKKFQIEEQDEGKAFDAILKKIDELTKLAEESGKGTEEVEALKTKVDELQKELDKKSNELSDGDDLKKQLTEAVESNKKLSEKMTIMERDACIKKALSEGRMLPESRQKYEDLYMQNPALMKEAIDNMPKVIELDTKGKGTANSEGESVEMSESEKAVHDAFGHTEEDIKKYRD